MPAGDQLPTQRPPEPTLLELARKKFTTLSRAEEKLFGAAQEGKEASALTGNEKEDNLANAASWNADRVVRAECIAWLCTDPQASAFVTYRGLTLSGMRIDAELGLSKAEIKFFLRLFDCAFSGNIVLRDAQLRGLDFSHCHIKSVNANRAKIRGAVLLRNGVKAEGEVSLSGATIGGDLDCEDAQFLNAKGKALCADQAKIEGSIFLSDGFKAEGEFRLLGATIGGGVECKGAHLSNVNGKAFSADGAKIGGSIFLSDGFKAEGEIRLLGATISGDLDCSGAQFLNAKGKALSADQAKIGGYVFLSDGFKAEGEFRLLGATIGGSVECRGAHLSNANGRSLSADGAKIAGNIFLCDGFKAEGTVSLAGADLGRLLIYSGLIEPEKAILDLRSAKVGTLWDDKGSWPSEGMLLLDGFNYERLDEQSPLDAKSRTDWLHRQPRLSFLPQPYEQLAAVFRQMGYERDARLVMIEKNRDRARFMQFPRQGWWWYNFFGRLIGYGYAPFRAFLMSVAIILLGAFLFHVGSSHGLISPTREGAYAKAPNGQFVLDNSGRREVLEDYPAFDAFVYSLESFVPLIKFDQTANWTPNANRRTEISSFYLRVPFTGRFLRYYLYCHIAAGWLLTSLWVGAVTGLVKS